MLQTIYYGRRLVSHPTDSSYDKFHQLLLIMRETFLSFAGNSQFLSGVSVSGS